MSAKDMGAGEMSAARPRVVIVGAGFGGLAAARRLAGKDVEVTLIDRRNHHLFQPLLYQVATAGLSPADIAAPIRSIMAGAGNIRVLLDEATGVDAPKGSTSGRLLLGRGGSIDYDWLILATGARHSYFGRDEWGRHAPGLKAIEDAIAIRRRMLLSLEHAETEEDRERRRALLTFVVIGGGPTGVEMAGAIAELTRRSATRDFRSITPHCSRVLLIEAGPRVLASFPPELSEKARKSLEGLGVEVRTGQRITDVQHQAVVIDQERIEAGTIIWAAGVQASEAGRWLAAGRDKSGRILVGADLCVPGHPNILAIGDTACTTGPDGRALPGIAPVAKQQGRYAAEVILGRRTGPFTYRHHGDLATIGRSHAVINWNGRHVSGLTAWLLWSLAHIWFLVGFRSRLIVGMQWMWNYMTYQRSARLITGDDAVITGDEAATPPQLAGGKAA